MPSVESNDGRKAAPGAARPDLRTFLDKKVAEYNRPAFIPNDPVRVPHQYSRKQDIEIAGFFAAVFAWGNRTTIIRKAEELMQLMDKAPYEFVLHHTDNDLRKLLGFKHRTFNPTDLLYFIAFFRHHYSHYDSLEDAFLRPWEDRAPALKEWDAERALSAFYHYFFSLDETPPRTFSPDPVAKNGSGEKVSDDWPSACAVPPRTRKHIASPEKHSSCKRINMFLRWMVRKDRQGVDFGLWRRIPPASLVCPLDLHVARVARRFELLSRPSADWTAAQELTGHLRTLDPADPVKYDFALFGLGVMEKF